MLLHKGDLKETLHTINHLYNWDGISVIDIAYRLNVSKGTIYKALRVYKLLHSDIFKSLNVTKMTMKTLLEFCKLNKDDQLILYNNKSKGGFSENRFNKTYTLLPEQLNKIFNDKVIEIELEGIRLKICRCEY